MKKMNTKKLMKNVKAVSPVIATLMLVIVAVAAAAGFYVWQTSWQETLTGDVETTTDAILDDILDDAEGGVTLLTFSGSTTLGPMIEDAIVDFEVAYPEIDAEVISQPGSSTGIANLIDGTCDIGMASRPLKATETDAGCVAYTVGYDGVVVAWPASGAAPVDGVGGTYNFSDGFDAAEMDLCLADAARTETFYFRGDGSGTEETFCNKLCASGHDTVPDMISAGDLLGTYATVGSNTEMAATLGGSGSVFGFISFGYVDSSMTVADFDAGSGMVTPSLDTIQTGAYGGARPLNLATVGVPDATAQTFISWIQSYAVNPGLMADHDFVSLF